MTSDKKFKVIQIKLRSDVELENQLIQYLESRGQRSGEPKHFLLDGFLKNRNLNSGIEQQEDNSKSLVEIPAVKAVEVKTTDIATAPEVITESEVNSEVSVDTNVETNVEARDIEQDVSKMKKSFGFLAHKG